MLLRRLRDRRRLVSCRRRLLANQFSKRLVDLPGVGENLRDIWLQDNDVRSRGITAGVRTPSTLGEIVFIPHSVS